MVLISWTFRNLDVDIASIIFMSVRSIETLSDTFAEDSSWLFTIHIQIQSHIRFYNDFIIIYKSIKSLWNAVKYWFITIFSPYWLITLWNTWKHWIWYLSTSAYIMIPIIRVLFHWQFSINRYESLEYEISAFN